MLKLSHHLNQLFGLPCAKGGGSGTNEGRENQDRCEQIHTASESGRLEDVAGHHNHAAQKGYLVSDLLRILRGGLRADDYSIRQALRAILDAAPKRVGAARYGTNFFGR